MPNLINTGLGRETIIRETDKALCIGLDRSTQAAAGNQWGQTAARVSEIWLPKSKVEWADYLAYGETLRVPAWLAREKGLPSC